MKLVVFALLLLSFSIGVRAEEGGAVVQPSLDRLELMIRREEFAQALQPLKNVELISQNPRWERMVEMAAVGELLTLRREGAAGADKVAVQLLIDFPNLDRSPEFLKLRREALRTNVEFCLDVAIDGFACAEALAKKIKGHGEPAPFYLEMAELFSNRLSLVAALPFLQLAQDQGQANPNAKSQCRLPLLSQNLLFKALSLPPGEAKKIAVDLAAGVCAAELKPLIDRAKKTNHPHLREAICQISAKEEKERALCSNPRRN